jgi:hypothetical protein
MSRHANTKDWPVAEDEQLVHIAYQCCAERPERLGRPSARFKWW